METPANNIGTEQEQTEGASVEIKNGRGRIWELDAFRGICILAVIVIHSVFDIQYFFRIELETPFIYDFLKDNGAVLFILLSGICATLGRRSVRRGIIVFSCGMLISLVTYCMTLLDMADRSIMIYFGILHMLGLCMVLYALYKRLNTVVIGIIGVIIVAASFFMQNIDVSTWLLIPLGITPPDFASGDYFPIIPNLGWFMIGTVLGRTLYARKTSLIPCRISNAAPIRFLSFCGRHSLWIYLAHQPVVYGIMMLIYYLCQ